MVDRTIYLDKAHTPDQSVRNIFGRQRASSALCRLFADNGLLSLDRIAGTCECRRKPASFTDVRFHRRSPTDAPTFTDVPDVHRRSPTFADVHRRSRVCGCGCSLLFSFLLQSRQTFNRSRSFRVKLCMFLSSLSDAVRRYVCCCFQAAKPPTDQQVSG